MFQNITQNCSQDGKIKNNIDFKSICKELFRYQNIIIYILTFFMSMLSIKNENSPFGLAMVAACIGETIPVVVVFIIAGIGTFLGTGISNLANYIVTSIIYFLLILFFKPKVAIDERNEVYKTGGKLFLSCMIVEVVKNLKGIFLLYDLFMGTISSILIYVFYKIFVNGLIVIKEFNNKKAYTLEELIGATIIISIASLSFNNLNVFSLNISNIIIILMIMILGWKNGVLLGGTVGIATGIATSIVSGTSFIQISMFAISGILSGILNRFGKIGVIIGFVFGNCILTYITNGNSYTITYFREIFVASIGLLFVPNKINLGLEDLFGRDKLLSNTGENRLEENKEITDKIKVVSDVLYELTNSKNSQIEEFEDIFVKDFIENMKDLKHNVFYDIIENTQGRIAKDICNCIQNKEIIVDNDLIDILKNYDNYIYYKDEKINNSIQEIIKLSNRVYKIVQINIAKMQERNENLNTISNSLKGVSKVLDECAKEMTYEKKNEFLNKEKELEILLKNKNIMVKKCNINKITNGKYIVKLYLDNNERVKSKDVIVNISDIISKCLGTKISFQREKENDSKDNYIQIYTSEDKYIMQVGSAKVSKDDSNVSGDCNLQIKLEDDKYLLAICDGMGSGEKARQSSKLAIKMIKKMINTGFDKENSIELINSTLNLNMNSEMYSSLDMLILDLYTGQAELIKNGACNTYIKNKKNIKKIESNNLPVGIVDKVELKSNSVNVSEGDIILMCSDGVLESKETSNKDWIEEFLKNVSTNNVQKIADLILAEAIDNSYGIVHDDMTVIVSKIIKRK